MLVDSQLLTGRVEVKNFPHPDDSGLPIGVFLFKKKSMDKKAFGFKNMARFQVV